MGWRRSPLGYATLFFAAHFPATNLNCRFQVTYHHAHRRGELWEQGDRPAAGAPDRSGRVDEALKVGAPQCQPTTCSSRPVPRAARAPRRHPACALVDLRRATRTAYARVLQTYVRFSLLFV